VPELSIIIPTLKPREEVECLDVLDRVDFSDYEVLVQSEDRATAAKNEGIRRAKSDKLVFLDDDSRPVENYLSQVAATLDEEAAITGKTVHSSDFTQILGLPHQVEKVWPTDQSRDDSDRELDWAEREARADVCADQQRRSEKQTPEQEPP